MTDILRDCLELEIWRRDRAAETRVGNALKRLGWQKVRARRGKELVWVYRPPDPVPTSEVGTGRNKVGTSNTDAIVPTVPTNNEVSPPQQSSRSFTDNNNKIGKNGKNSRNNPMLEPCSNLVPTDQESPEVGTDDWTEVAPE